MDGFVVFGNYHVLPNFLVVLWLMLRLRLEFGCDKSKCSKLDFRKNWILKKLHSIWKVEVLKNWKTSKKLKTSKTGSLQKLKTSKRWKVKKRLLKFKTSINKSPLTFEDLKYLKMLEKLYLNWGFRSSKKIRIDILI